MYDTAQQARPVEMRVPQHTYAGHSLPLPAGSVAPLGERTFLTRGRDTTARAAGGE